MPVASSQFDTLAIRNRLSDWTRRDIFQRHVYQITTAGSQIKAQS